MSQVSQFVPWEMIEMESLLITAVSTWLLSIRTVFSVVSQFVHKTVHKTEIKPFSITKNHCFMDSFNCCFTILPKKKLFVSTWNDLPRCVQHAESSLCGPELSIQQQPGTPPGTGHLTKQETHGSLMTPFGSVSKPCTPVVHIKIAGIYGCE